MKKFFGVLLAAAFIGTGAMNVAAKSPKDDTKTVFTVSPAMTCQNCENKIKGNLRFEKGVSEILTNLQEQTVTIKYDTTKTDCAKIIKAFKKIGYTATEATCSPAAKGSCCKEGGSCCPAE